MRKFLKGQKGINLISLSVAVTVILILTGITLYNATGNIKISKLKAMQTDVENLNDKVSSYYSQYGELPVNRNIEYTNINKIKNSGVISSSVDTGKFYVIDLSKIENLTLNYGEDYEKIKNGEATTSEQINELTDIYIINETSHNVFYVEGINLNDKNYYTNYTDADIDTKAVELKYYDNVEIPNGFYYVGGKKNTGLIISDVQGDDLENSKNGNQFVWIPVENERDYVKSNTINSTGISDTTAYLPNDVVRSDTAESNAEIEKQLVMQAKGYFISRYEMGTENNNIVSKKNATTFTNTTSLENAKANAKTFKNDDAVKSALCSSIQWDIAANILNLNSTGNNYRMVLYVEPRESWSAEYDKTATYTDKNKDTATIPKGFKVSRKANESTISTGLVVQAPDGSEFVWVPVPDVVYDDNNKEIGIEYTPMAELQTNSTVNYQGMLYEFSGYTSTYKNTYKTGTTNYREPTLITGNDSDTSADVSSVSGNSYDASPGYYNILLGYTSAANFGKDLQSQYNKMIESIVKYKGFYIGRYELGLENNSPVSKSASKNSSVITANANNNSTYRWYGLYKACKTYNADGTTSTMLWGSQYDAVMNWMGKQGKNIGDKNENKTNTTEITGKYSADILNNIFDLYGGHKEWTLEGVGNNQRLTRGGIYDGAYSPANRDSNDTLLPDQTGKGNNTRLTLYIN